MKFRTKAENLEQLENRIAPAFVLPQLRIDLESYRKDCTNFLAQIEGKKWTDISLVVRSSAQSEDAENSSLAGHFCSILNVRGKEEIRDALEKVADSLEQDKDQIFVQPMLTDVKLSGVAFTKDPSSGSGYYIINYDDSSTSTSSVTSGSTNNLKTFVHCKKNPIAPPNALHKTVNLLAHLENLYECDQLDVEFAIDNKDDLYLLQVRPLTSQNEKKFDTNTHYKSLENIARKVKNLNQPHPYMYGSRTVFGVMPDWNPAEIIGVRPRPLAMSLYRELVTDAIWAYQRDNYGYRNLRSFPLMTDFNGLPYIDTRISFNSFIPGDLDAGIAERLVDYYIDRLVENPKYHDKVEFQIAYTCYSFNLEEKLTKLETSNFSKDDQAKILDSLKNLTNKIISPENGYWQKDLERIEKLKKRHHEIMTSNLDYIGKIYWLLEDCKRYGTLPFAGLARAGFIAVQLLQSLVDVGVITVDEQEGFMRSLNTVSSKMFSAKAQMSRETFLSEYGHLRPGTYDILSPRYDEDPDSYFDWDMPSTTEHVTESNNFRLSLDQMRKIEYLLKEHGFEHDVIEFFDFIKNGIEGREYSKFIFSRSLSDALSLFKKYGQEQGIPPEDLSFTNINNVRELYIGSYDPYEYIFDSIKVGKERYSSTCQTILPPLISSENDVWSFHQPVFEPNFVTQKTIKGSIANVNDKDLTNKIIMIPNADPGFDWIFSRGISGFITKFGGVNSHMAIRAGELGISAVIGAGETLYEHWATAKTLELDPTNKQVKILS